MGRDTGSLPLFEATALLPANPPPNAKVRELMQSVAEAIAENRLLIDELAAKHADLIAECQRRTLEAAIENGNPTDTIPQFDDLFVVRFLQSNLPDVQKAEDSLVATLNWRIAQAVALDTVRNGGPPPNDDLCGGHCVVALHKTSKQNEPVLIVRSGLTNTATLLQVASGPQITDWILFQREAALGICDAETRRTGQFVKCISINDFAGIRLFGFDRRFMQALGAASKLSEQYYCQLLGTGIMINLPGWAKPVLSMAKLLMSQRMLEKIKFCPASPSAKNEKEVFTNCPWAKTKFDPENLPTFLGGKCECKQFGGCVQGVPNDFVGIVTPTTSVRSTASKDLATMSHLSNTVKSFTLAPKASEIVQLGPEGRILHYGVSVQDNHGVHLTIIHGGKTVVDKKIKGTDAGHFELAGQVTIKLDNASSMTKTKHVELKYAFE